MQAVVRAAEELTKTVAIASGNARAQKRMEEAKYLKITADFGGSVQALLTAARLFDGAGFRARAVAARAEASITEGEALVLESEKLHQEGKLGDIVQNLQRAETLFMSALDAEAQIRISSAPGSGVKIVAMGNAADDGGTGSFDDNLGDAGAQQHLVDLKKFRSRIAGDIVLREVGSALDAREYDLALRLMLQAEVHYEGIGRAGKWVTTVTSAVASCCGKDNGGGGTSPKDLVVKRAARDGERLRVDAAAAILKGKDAVKAQELLSMAEASMVWAGVDLVAAGAAAVAKDINVFQNRAAGDDICRGLIDLLLAGDLERVKDMLAKALNRYREVGMAPSQGLPEKERCNVNCGVVVLHER